MLSYYNYINESSKISFEKGDIVLGVGTVSNLDLSGQIGRISNKRYSGAYTVLFNDQFSNKLYSKTWEIGRRDLDNIIKLENDNNITTDEILPNIFTLIKHLDIKDADYISVDKKQNNYISYLPKQKTHLIKDGDHWNNQHRLTTRIGRFISKYNKEIPQPTIEVLVNNYKSNHDLYFNSERIFKLVKGKEIAKWYDGTNYVSGGGTLNSSCMMGKSSKKFRVYMNNPEVCGLLIKRDDNNKLLGRALIWETNKGTYMDRPYCRYDSDILLFYKFADLNKWMRYDKNYEDKIKVKIIENDYKGSQYPYMDTFRYLFKKKNKSWYLGSHWYEDRNYNKELDYY